MSPLLPMFARWAAYQQMTPEQQADIDADRLIPTGETIRLLAAWFATPMAVCPVCDLEFEQNRTGPALTYCSPRCRWRSYWERRGRDLYQARRTTAA